MKLTLSFCVFIGAFLTVSCGIVERQAKPLKFLVLQKSDILSDVNVLVKPEGNQTQTFPQTVEVEEERIPTTTDSDNESEEEEADARDEATTNQPSESWNPPEGWKELNFPVIPIESGNGGEEYVAGVVDISNTNANISITKGIFVGRETCQCGTPSGKIVMGETARINDIPWTVGLARAGFFGFGASKKPYCGGTLINNRYVLTASHCVDAMFAGGIKVWLNDEDLLSTSDTSGRLVYDVERIIMHPKYDRRTVNFDIALLKLAKPVPISLAQNSATYITPACIPINNDADFAGQLGLVAGWGVTSQGGSQANVLMKVNVPIIPNDKCNTDTEYAGKITENMMCAGYIEEGGKDSCQGDSGGPLIIENNGRRTLVGVVSWGFGCAKPRAPGVYTRVGQFPAWILENTRDAEWCTE